MSAKKKLARKSKTARKTKIKKKRAVKRKPIKKRARAVSKKPKEDIIGIVTHYFPKVRAAVIKLKKPLSIGEVVKIKGYTTDFTQNVTSIQINRVPIQTAKKGQEIGLLVDSRVRHNDIVYKG